VAVVEVLVRPRDEGDRAGARERIQAAARHVLVRFVDRRDEDMGALGGGAAENIVPEVEALLYAVAGDVAAGAAVDVESVRAVAKRVVARVAAREYRLYLRSYDEGLADFAGHAANVAMMTAAMLLEASYPEAICADAAAAALLHDTGQLLLPESVRGKPEPLLDARGKHLYRHHPFLGARALLTGGCPPLWIAAALEHHRGMDGHGYPALLSASPPHEAVGMLSLANYVDNKRASIGGRANSPDDALGQALSLADRYFDASAIALFMRALGLYPPGTTVELSDGAYAVVTRANPTDARRPEVELLFGERKGRRFELREFDTVERRYVRSIVRAVPPPIVPLEPEEPHPALD
jgi:HD-GYP domain-containing protein (c-di-GMP phosphodiesterase class II)